jgi:putative FmdB family regulatory protein
MPVYDYLCTACDHRADILHGINDPGPNFCPSCGAEGAMRKQFAAPAIHFKGSGWAKKDRGASNATRAAAKAAAGGDTPATPPDSQDSPDSQASQDSPGKPSAPAESPETPKPSKPSTPD